jgi:septum formation protein
MTSPTPPALWLASTSPRRRHLLQQAGIRFELCEPGPEYADGRGDHDHGETGVPHLLAVARARRKALGAVVPAGITPVLGVDTVVDLDGDELGKPRDRDGAAAMLRRLFGREHRVHTAHCLVWPSGAVVEELATAVVAGRVPSPAELAHYLDSGDWRGKAGAYGLQDPSQSFLRRVEGADDTVVGLHLAAVQRLLAAGPGGP